MPMRPPIHRPLGHRDRKPLESEARGTAHERGYGWAWQKLRLLVLAQEPLCRICQAAGLITAATEVDHITPKARGGGDELDNLQSVCRPCHLRKSSTEAHQFSRSGEPTADRFACRLTVVCGPPGSGKTTFVRERAKAGDAIWDWDHVLAAVTGQPLYTRPPRFFALMTALRDTFDSQLMSGCGIAAAWLIDTAADPAAEARWRTRGATVVVLDTPLEECVRRIEADPARAAMRDQLVTAAGEWFRRRATPGGASIPRADVPDLRAPLRTLSGKTRGFDPHG